MPCEQRMEPSAALRGRGRADGRAGALPRCIAQRGTGAARSRTGAQLSTRCGIGCAPSSTKEAASSILQGGRCARRRAAQGPPACRAGRSLPPSVWRHASGGVSRGLRGLVLRATMTPTRADPNSRPFSTPVPCSRRAIRPPLATLAPSPLRIVTRASIPAGQSRVRGGGAAPRAPRSPSLASLPP